MDANSERLDVGLRPLDTNRDLPLIKAWLHAPHVRNWWGDPEEQLAEVSHRPEGGGELIITLGNAAVGYVRWESLSRGTLDRYGLRDLPENTVDIDIAIGDFNQLGRGIGTAALCRLVEKLSTETAAPLFVLFTSIRNTAAIRSYSKAGFRKLRLYDDGPYGMCWIMQWNPVERAGERPQGEQ